MYSSFSKNILKTGKSFLLFYLILSQLSLISYNYNRNNKSNDDYLKTTEKYFLSNSGIQNIEINFNKVSASNQIINIIKLASDKEEVLISYVLSDIIILSYIGSDESFEYKLTHTLEKTNPRSPPCFSTLYL